MERRIRISSLFVAAGLLVAIISLLVNHPLAFIFFIAIGVLLVAIGVVLYLIALIREPGRHAKFVDVTPGDRSKTVVEDRAV